jgi:SAM-dependent methyltransferase
MHSPAEPPSPWLVRFSPLVRVGGTVLDLACGAGRHARYLAGRGLRVEAVDRDASAIAALDGTPGVSTRIADLEGGPWPYGGRTFDAVVVTRYLHRPLFGPILAALADGAVLVYDTFMRGQQRLGRPSRPEFLLEPGELLSAFAALTVIAFEQGRVESTPPAVVQRICAVRAADPASIVLP